MGKIKKKYIRDDLEELAAMDLWPLTNIQLMAPSLESLLFPIVNTRKDTSNDEDLFMGFCRRKGEFLRFISLAFKSGAIKNSGPPEFYKNLDSISKKEKWGQPKDILSWMYRKEYFVPDGLIDAIEGKGQDKIVDLLKTMRIGFLHWLETGQNPQPEAEPTTQNQKDSSKRGPGRSKKVDWDALGKKVDFRKLKGRYTTLSGIRGCIELWLGLGLKKDEWPGASADSAEWQKAVGNSGNYKGGLSAKRVESCISGKLKKIEKVGN